MKKKAKKIKAVFLDAGGTLFRPYPSVGEIYARTAARFGTDSDPEVLESEFLAAWNRRGGLSSLGEETNEVKERAWWHSLVREVFESSGGVSRFEEFFEALHRSFEEKHLWEIYPEVLDALRDLKAAGLTLAIVSNWDLRLPRLVRNLGLADYFDFLLSSSVCGATKPSPKIFHEALAQAKVAPHEAVHVGDTYDEDFVGASRVGIHALLIDRSGTGNSVPKEAKLRSLAELRDWI